MSASAKAGRTSWPTTSGTMTFLVSLVMASTIEMSTEAPSSSSSSGGVTTTPSTLPMTALKMASASLPPAERVNATHMFTVVGSADMASRPARSVDEILAPSSVVIDHMIKGSTTRLTPWIAVCSRTRNAAAASSDVGSVRPDRKKMPHVAPHPTVSSGRNKPATARARWMH